MRLTPLGERFLADLRPSYDGLANAVSRAKAAAREVTGKPVLVYPNSGEEWDARRRAWAGRSRFSAGQPRQWMAAGAKIAGGCCRVRPADIAVIAQAAASVGQAPASWG